eukprot:5375146-Pyramimonas_sp.AAC.1
MTAGGRRRNRMRRGMTRMGRGDYRCFWPHPLRRPCSVGTCFTATASIATAWLARSRRSSAALSAAMSLRALWVVRARRGLRLLQPPRLRMTESTAQPATLELR